MSDGLTYSESLTAGRPVSSPHPIVPSFAPPARAIHSRNYNAPSTRPCTAPSMRRPQPLHAQPAAIASGRAPARAGRTRRCRARPCLARVAGAAAVRSPCLHELQAAPLPSAGRSRRRRTRPQLHHPRALRADPGRLPVRSAPLRAPPEEREYGRVRGGS